MNRLKEKYPLKGFIDTHVHTKPDIKPRLLTDIEAARAASHEKMRAIVIKSHAEPTVSRAVLAEQETGFKVFGGICLNNNVGGLNCEAVKTTASLGGKVVWLPTISRNDMDINLKDNWYNLEEILTVIAENDLILATGHLSVEDIFQVLDLAVSMGIEKILINHPLTRVVGATIEEQKEMSRTAFLEHCYVACLPGHDGLDPLRIAEAIKKVGARKCIMATDLGQIHNQEPVTGLKSFIKSMMDSGISGKDIEKMCLTNPYRLFF